jgi:hypothetical protein
MKKEVKIIKIKSSCGGQGCEIKPYYISVAKPKNNLVRKAA